MDLIPVEVETWSVGTNENGGVKLNVFIEGTHYTIQVSKKDVEIMNIILRIKARMES